MNQEKIIQAIAAYLERNTEHIWHSQGERMAFSEPCEYPVFSEQSFLHARATELAAAIAPHLKAGAGEQALKACKIVVDGYEGDDMENMSERDNLFFRECKKACTFTS